MIKLSSEDRKVIELLITPSWLSGLIAIIAALIISGGAIIAFEIHNDALTQQLLSWQQSSQPQPTLTTADQLVVSEKPTLQSSWPLLVFWSMTGLIVYSVAASIIKSVSRAEEVRESLEYINAKPKALLETTAEHLVLRVIGSLILIGFVVAFWKLIIPYSITAAHAAAADILSLEGFLYSVLSLSLILISVHLLTIALRLALGTVRVFHDA